MCLTAIVATSLSHEEPDRNSERIMAYPRVRASLSGSVRSYKLAIEVWESSCMPQRLSSRLPNPSMIVL